MHTSCHRISSKEHAKGKSVDLGCVRPILFFMMISNCWQSTVSYPHEGTSVVPGEHLCEWSPPFVAKRVGEALQPGPPGGWTELKFGISNPTSIASKVSTFRDITSNHELDFVFAAETAATASAQKSFGKAFKQALPHHVWGQPVPAKKERRDGLESIRGHASGVGMFSRPYFRPAWKTIEHEWYASSRLARGVMNHRGIMLQIIVIYAQPACVPNAAEYNDGLLQEAYKASQHLPLPTIIAGDFNGEPLSWPTGTFLQSQGFTSLAWHHERLYGTPIPKTCREATHLIQHCSALDWLVQCVRLRFPRNPTLIATN